LPHKPVLQDFCELVITTRSLMAGFDSKMPKTPTVISTTRKAIPYMCFSIISWTSNSLQPNNCWPCTQCSL